MKKALLSFALLLAGMTMTLMSCDKELTLEERIAEEEKKLAPEEKQLLHQTPAFEDWNYEADNYFRNRELEVQAAASEETIDGWRITKDGQGLVTRVLFDDITQQQPPKNGRAFLIEFFGEAAAEQFVETDYEGRPDNWELFVQYCGDLEVSQYYFKYDEQGVMRMAQGAYYPTNGLSPVPTISSYVARMIFASCLSQSVSLISEKTPLRIMLIPEGTYYVPTLVYRLMVNHGDGPIVEDRVAWVDAHSGRLLRVFFQFI